MKFFSFVVAVLSCLSIVNAQRCGCSDCSNTVLNNYAGAHTCGARIAFLESTGKTEEEACSRVAGTEFPSICGPSCDPALCEGRMNDSADEEFPSVCGPFCDPDLCEAIPESTGGPALAPTLEPTLELTRNPSLRPNLLPTHEPTHEPSPLPTAEDSAIYPAEHCGCYDCTEQVCNAIADKYTCGARIIYVIGDVDTYDTYATEEQACRLVAGEEFPGICGSACDPDSCDGRSPPSNGSEPTSTPNNSVSEPTPPLTPKSSLYCFPEYAQRTRFQNVWGKYTVEVKEGASCGPGSNDFTTNAVSVDNGELKLQFKKGANSWEGSEVRFILPEEERPFTYGTYSFSVKTVSVLDAITSAVIDAVLPQSLVLGLFTWDDTESYAIHENWNHEMDVEISRWNIPGNPDAQFLVQPPEDPQFVRFYTGAGSTYDQGGHVYDFTWNPGKVTWYTDAAGGNYHSYATEDAIFAGVNDYVQCLPANVEIRLNLWNMFGNAMPVGMSTNQMVEVVIDDFTFTPSNLGYVLDGGYCTKPYQCDASSTCVSGICLLDV